MLRSLAVLSCLTILGASAAASFADLRSDARLHPAPWVLSWRAGMPHILLLTGEDGADLRLGSRALGIEDIGALGDDGNAVVLGDAQGCTDIAYTADDPPCLRDSSRLTPFRGPYRAA